MRSWLPLLFGMLAFPGFAGAQQFGEVGEPLGKLPSTVQIEKGKLSIFIDYSNPEQKEGGWSRVFDYGEAPEEAQFVSAYLVNDSGSDVEVPNQDGDIYLKQEVKINGKWVRSHPHRYSGCGNSYASAKLPPGKFLVRPVLLDSSDTDDPSPVRYRIYDSTEKLRALVSNEGEARVSPVLVAKSHFDIMAINTAKLPILLQLVSGEIKVKAIDHMEPRMAALGRLERFPGTSDMVAAIEKCMIESLSGEEGISDYGSMFHVLSLKAPPERVLRMAQAFLEQSNDPRARYSAIYAAARIPNGEGKVAVHFFDFLFSNPKSADFVTAMNCWAGGNIASKEEVAQRLKSWQKDPQLTDEGRRAALEAYRRICPNEFFHARWNLDHKTKNVDVTIHNISREPIQFSYTHPFDIVKFELLDEEKIPFAEDPRFLNENYGEEKMKTVTLLPGEKFVFPALNPWPLFSWPKWFPISGGLRVMVEIPSLGEVGSGYGTTSHLKFRSDEFEVIRDLLDKPLVLSE